MQILDMAVQNTSLSNVKTTFYTCMSEGEFVNRFYELLVETCPPLEFDLEGKNLQEKENMLRETMEMVFQQGQGNFESRQSTNPLLNPLYREFWITTLVKAISEYDDDFDTQRMREWREVLFEGTK